MIDDDTPTGELFAVKMHNWVPITVEQMCDWGNHTLCTAESHRARDITWPKLAKRSIRYRINRRREQVARRIAPWAFRVEDDDRG